MASLAHKLTPLSILYPSKHLGDTLGAPRRYVPIGTVTARLAEDSVRWERDLSGCEYGGALRAKTHTAGQRQSRFAKFVAYLWLTRSAAFRPWTRALDESVE